jgi:LysR family cyn operon transcriptional activator
MDLRHLTYLLAVADHGGFTRASKAIFVSQPALSLAVKELEDELGVELL